MPPLCREGGRGRGLEFIRGREFVGGIFSAPYLCRWGGGTRILSIGDDKIVCFGRGGEWVL